MHAPGARALLWSAMLVAGGASAAPCHDVLGDWSFELSCVSTDVSPPHFGTSFPTGTITHQSGCTFAGLLNGYPWVGVLHGDGNRTVSADFGGAKATGELASQRAGRFTQMEFAYTFTGPTPGSPTACTGIATRD